MTDFLAWFVNDGSGLLALYIAARTLLWMSRKAELDAASHKVEIQDLIWIQRHVSDLHRRVDILEGKDNDESEGDGS